MSLTFLQVESVAEAQQALSQYGEDAKLISGGVAVVLMLREQLIAPEALIDLGRLSELRYERVQADGFHLGPLQRLSEVQNSPVIQAALPGLAEACRVVGNVRVRNQATIGGNLAEADYASDPPAMLLALQAEVTAAKSGSSRSIPLTEFFQGFYSTALEADEMITDVFIPRPAAGTRMSYLKFKSRSAEDRPCVGVAVVGAFEGEICQDLRIAVGAATEVPVRLAEFEGLAQGERLMEGLIAEIAAGYARNIDPLEDIRGSAWYRRQMIEVHVRRALEEVADGSR